MVKNSAYQVFSVAVILLQSLGRVELSQDAVQAALVPVICDAATVRNIACQISDGLPRDVTVLCQEHVKHQERDLRRDRKT